MKSNSSALRRAILAASAAALVSVPVFAQAVPSGATILRRMDDNARVSSASYEAVLTITSGKRIKVKALKAVGLGDEGLVEFTNPEDRGVKYLKLGDELWIYFPEEDDTVRISGTQLKEGFMGSDISYGDVLDSETLAATYAVSVEGEESLDGRPCWVLSLTATVKTAPYDKRRMWVDQERSIALKEEMYSKSGTLLKSSRVTAVEASGGRWYAKRFEMRDARKKDSLSVFEISAMRFDVKVDPALFSLQGLKK